jgi:hypothetical protein
LEAHVCQFNASNADLQNFNKHNFNKHNFQKSRYSKIYWRINMERKSTLKWYLKFITSGILSITYSVSISQAQQVVTSPFVDNGADIGTIIPNITTSSNYNYAVIIENGGKVVLQGGQIARSGLMAMGILADSGAQVTTSTATPHPATKPSASRRAMRMTKRRQQP